MRRSFAPSQLKKRLSCDNSSSFPSSTSAHTSSHDDEITIQRLPLFGFLSIPNNLKKQFKIPSGCTISNENIELRKKKTLGIRRSLPQVIPGGYIAPLPRTIVDESVMDDEEEDVPSKSSEFPPHEPLVLWQNPEDEKHVVQVIPQLACRLRPHQREGVQFLFECTMRLRGFEGEGCILADDMGLGKTLMSLTLLWTLLNQGMQTDSSKSAVQKAMIVCPTSLVGNWDNELRKWIGDHCPTFAVKSDPKKMIRNFIGHRGKGILIISYETQRRYSDMFTANEGKGIGGYTSCCELLICDEAHKLKNADSGLSKSLNLLPARKRILLSGTPMQNELSEFFNMVNFCNPDVLGSINHFRKKYENPILRAREPDATDREIEKADVLQKELSTIVNEFILKRGNILNAQHLPPKLVQFVCCKLTPLQERLYDCVLNSKEARHLRDGKQTNTLNSLRHMLSICSHPDLIIASYRHKQIENNGLEDEVLEELYQVMMEYNHSNTSGPKSLTKPAGGLGGAGGAAGRADRAALRKIKMSNGFGSMNSSRSGFDPERSGKFLVLFRLMSTLRNTCRDRIVVVSNTTQTLDLVETMCNDNNWPQLRLDGSTAAQKRTKLVDVFNDPCSNSFAFLLSSKAGGCGINLIGGNRLVMMDPDWNPASDKQAAARIWREGQQKRCYIYRLMSTCTIEEKIIQRQLSKEGLQSIVDNTEQVNTFSSSELKSLFQRDNALDTRSNTHDTLRCKRCKCVSQISVSSHKSHALTEKHAEILVDYLAKVYGKIEEIIEVNSLARAGQADVWDKSTVVEAQLTFTRDVATLSDELQREVQLIPYKSMPEVSKRIRTVMMGVDQDLKDEFGVQNVTLFNDFVASWTDLVPVLQNITKQHAREMDASVKKSVKVKSNHLHSEKENEVNFAVNVIKLDNNCDEGDESEEDEYVEQEGCPEEEDFNRWSHHSSVRTCYGDESLQKAMSMGDNDDHGDNTISFVFGLEVNWDLLQQKIAINADRDEQRRLQVEADLLELNRAREEARRRKSEENTSLVEIPLDDAEISGAIKKQRTSARKKSLKEERPLDEDNSSSSGDESACFVEDEKFNSKDKTKNMSKNDASKKKTKTIVKSEKRKKSEDRKRRSAGESDDSESSGNELCDEDVCADESDDSSRLTVGNRLAAAKPAGNKAEADNGRNKRARTVIIDDSDDEADSSEEEQSATLTVEDEGEARRGRLEDIDAADDTTDSDVAHLRRSRSGSADKPAAQGLNEFGNSDSAVEEMALTWNCVSCTFMNKYPTRVCDVCGCRKPRAATSQGNSQETQLGRKPTSSSSSTAVKGRLALPKKKGIILRKH